MKTFGIAFVLYILLTAALIGAPASREEVLAAIETVERNYVSSAALEAGQTIFRFVEESPDVSVALTEQRTPWIDETWKLDPPKMGEAAGTLILIAYFAGCVKSQLSDPERGDDPYLGWQYAIAAYQVLKTKLPLKSRSLEKLEKMQRDGTLKSHAERIRKKG